MPSISDARILIIATNGFEQSELEVPRDQLREAGATVDVASLDGQAITGWDKKDWGSSVDADRKIADCSVEEYSALVIPGGQINPDILRDNAETVQLVKDFVASGKTVAAICHGPWLLVQADAVRGREVTSYSSIRKDLENAGALWTDKEVVVDQAIVTSRNPGDLDAFVAKIIEEVEEGRHDRKAA